MRDNRALNTPDISNRTAMAPEAMQLFSRRTKPLPAMAVHLTRKRGPPERHLFRKFSTNWANSAVFSFWLFKARHTRA